jgi:hypothetical protein
MTSAGSVLDVLELVDGIANSRLQPIVAERRRNQSNQFVCLWRVARATRQLPQWD